MEKKLLFRNHSLFEITEKNEFFQVDTISNRQSEFKIQD